MPRDQEASTPIASDEHVRYRERLQHQRHHDDPGLEVVHDRGLRWDRAACIAWTPRFSGSGSSARTSGGSQLQIVPRSARMRAGSRSTGGCRASQRWNSAHCRCRFSTCSRSVASLSCFVTSSHLIIAWRLAGPASIHALTGSCRDSVVWLSQRPPLAYRRSVVRLQASRRAMNQQAAAASTVPHQNHSPKRVNQVIREE